MQLSYVTHTQAALPLSQIYHVPTLRIFPSSQHLEHFSFSLVMPSIHSIASSVPSLTCVMSLPTPYHCLRHATAQAMSLAVSFQCLCCAIACAMTSLMPCQCLCAQGCLDNVPGPSSLLVAYYFIVNTTTHCLSSLYQGQCAP